MIRKSFFPVRIVDYDYPNHDQNQTDDVCPIDNLSQNQIGEGGTEDGNKIDETSSSCGTKFLDANEVKQETNECDTGSQIDCVYPKHWINQCRECPDFLCQSSHSKEKNTDNRASRCYLKR